MSTAPVVQHDFLGRFKQVRRSGESWTARCPAHDDSTPSLSISDGGDKWLLKCHGGCTTEAVCAAAGLEMRDLFKGATSSAAPRIAAVYEYSDEAGKLLFQTVRYEPKDFRQRQPDGKGGWTWNLQGVRRVLYQLPEVVAASDVLMCEGEKDVETARVWNLVATCNPMGAGKWRDEYAEFLRGKRVTIIADADEPGRKHAQQVAASLTGKAQSVKVIELRGAKDLTEWAAKGGTHDALSELIRNAPQSKASAPEPQIESAFDVVMADAVDPKKIQWLWPKRVPLGHLTIFCGSPDNGKSLVTLFLVAAMTTGRAFPDAPNSTTPSEVLILSGEDGIEDTVVPRLMAAGADLAKVHILKSVTFGNKSNKKETRYVQLDTDVKMLLDYLVAHAAIKLVVIDPVSNYLGSVKMTDEQNVRRVLNPVKDVAESTGCALVGVMHLNKKEELSAIHRIAGAMAFVGVARATWMFAANPKDPDVPEGLQPIDTFSMLRVKVNIAERSGGLTYRIKAEPVPVENSEEWYPYIEWTGTTDKNADSVLKEKSAKPNHRPPDEREDAMDWLKEFLKDGSQPAEDIYEQGDGLHGFSKRTLQRAKKEIGAVARKQADKWYWVLGDGWL